MLEIDAWLAARRLYSEAGFPPLVMGRLRKVQKHVEESFTKYDKYPKFIAVEGVGFLKNCESIRRLAIPNKDDTALITAAVAERLYKIGMADARSRDSYIVSAKWTVVPSEVIADHVVVIASFVEYEVRK